MKKAVAPIPPRNGIAPSCVAMCPGHWATILDFLQDRFPHLGEAILRERLQNGEIVDDAGQPVAASQPYVKGGYLWYYRTVRQETPVPFNIDILYRDERLVVIDKPHFLSTIPAGRHVQETALVRLRRLLDTQDVAPVHRLDRETAGVLIFSLDPACRSAYQQLFENRQVRKEYEAIAPLRPDLTLPRVHRSRLENSSADFFTVCETAGEANSETRISLMETHGHWARYRLEPHTGKKHQLRAHMAALGIPICHDPWYPVVQAEKGDDFSQPLLLLARSIEFTDPYSGQTRCFASRRQLVWPVDRAS